VLAVISCGFFAWAGRLTWGIAGSIIFGIVLVFGATQIVSFFHPPLARVEERAMADDVEMEITPLVKP